MLLKSITSERDALLQDRTAFAMAKFIELCWGAGKQKTQDTVVKRLWGYGLDRHLKPSCGCSHRLLCLDKHSTPAIGAEITGVDGILTHLRQVREQEAAENRKKKKRRRARTYSMTVDCRLLLGCCCVSIISLKLWRANGLSLELEAAEDVDDSVLDAAEGSEQSEALISKRSTS